MNNRQHCLLCDNQIKDLETGVRCGITNEKPVFSKICDKIDINKKFFKKLEEISLEEELVTKSKGITILNLVFFLLVGLGFITAGVIMLQMSNSAGVYSMIPIILIVIGLVIVPMATGPVRKYIQDKKRVNSKIKTVKNVLSIYNLDYVYDIKIDKGRHNILDVSLKVDLIKSGKVASQYSNKYTYNNNEKTIDNSGVGTIMGSVEDKFGM